MLLNQYNYPPKPQNQVQKQPQQKIHKIQDSLALRILINTKQKEIENIANIFRLTYYVNEQQGYIETFEQENNKLDNYMMDQNEENPSAYFMEQVNILLEDVKKSIKTKEYECNSDEFQKIQKMIKKNQAYQKIFKERAQLKFVNFDNSNFIETINSYVPDVLKKYVIDNQISLKVCTINKPDQLNLNFFDYFLINMSQNGLFTDSFGQDLYDTNKLFKQKIKSIKYEIQQNNSLLLETLDFNQKGGDNDKDKQDTDYIFVNNNTVSKNTPLTLCIQTASEEKSCLANLKLILEKIQMNNLNNHRGYFQFGLSFNNSCSEVYLKSIIEYLKELNQLQKDNFFKLPSEFWIIVSEGNENRVLNIMNKLFSKKDENNFDNFKPRKVNYISYYSANPVDKKYFSNEIKDIIKKAQEKGLQAVPFVLNDDQVTFEQQYQQPIVLKRGAVISRNIRNFSFPSPVNPYVPKPKKESQEEVYKDTFKIDLVKMQMQGQLQNSISPIFEDGAGYSFINNGTMKQNKLDQSLSKMIKIYLQIGVKQFSYQMNLLNHQFTSTFCELKFSDDSIQFIGGKKTDNKKINLTQFYAEGADDQQDDEMQVEDLFDDDEKLEVEEYKKQKDGEVKYKRPQLIIRGNDECINLIGYIIQDIEQNKYILHEIKLTSNIPKDVTKLFNQLETIYKVWINVGQKSVTIQGYRKTLKNLLPIIYKAILEIPLQSEDQQIALFKDLKIPSHWEKQDDNLKLVNISLASEEGRKVIDQFQKSMQGTPVIKIERIQNISLMKNYLFEKQKLIEKGNATERLLFHGSRLCNPSIIYSSSEQGFDFRLGSEGGAYGKGTYFHDDSQYSNSFKFTLPNGRSQMFLASVLIGNCIAHAPQQFLAPPFINPVKGIRYDSVRCLSQQGHNQYIVYHNSKSYPLYLITY